MDSGKRSFLGFVQKAADILNNIVEQLCLVSMAGMTLIVLLGVLFRYVFRMPLSWTEELSRYLMIWAAALAMSIGIKENGHVGLTVLMETTKSKALKTILGTVIFLTTLSFLTIMIYYSIGMVIEAKSQISQGLEISMVLPTLAIPVSMCIAFVQLIFRYILDLKNFSQPDFRKEIIDI